MEDKNKRISLWAGLGLLGLAGVATVTGYAITQHRLQKVAKLNRSGLTMDLQGLRHLIRQTAQGKWTNSDGQTLLAIRRSVFARVASLEVAEPDMGKLWARLLNYLNLVMGYLGAGVADNADLLVAFEQALIRLEAALDEHHPDVKAVTMVLEELDRLI